MIKAYRAFITFLILASILPIVALVGWWPVIGERIRLRLRRQWVKWVLWGLNIRLTWHGNVPKVPCILMANHRSYIDPLLILKYILAYPLAKAELARWPFISTVVKMTGIYFVKREEASDRKRAMATVVAAVKKGATIINFAEGTTHAEAKLRPFKKGLFQAAAEQGIAIVPIALDYADEQDYWIGDDLFISHFFRRFGTRRMECTVYIGEPMVSDDMNVLINGCQEYIQIHLNKIRSKYGLHVAGEVNG